MEGKPKDNQKSGNINRRRFLRGAVVTLIGAGVAGALYNESRSSYDAEAEFFGKVHTPATGSVPELWSIVVLLNGEKHTINVSKERFNSFQTIGTKVKVTVLKIPGYHPEIILNPGPPQS